MNKYCIVILIYIFFSSAVSYSADVPVMRYTQKPLASWDGGRLALRFSCEVEGKMKGPLSYLSQPVYISGNDTVYFPEVGFYSRSGFRYERRRKHMSGMSRPERMVRCDSQQSRYDYDETMSVPALADGSIYIYRRLGMCRFGNVVAVDTVSVPPFHDNSHCETDEAASSQKLALMKIRSAKVVLHLDYKVADWHVIRELGCNDAELSRADTLFVSLLGDTSQCRVVDVTVTGYASPEGEWNYNRTLSEKRAAGVLDWILSSYPMLASQCKVRSFGEGEDWKGLCNSISSGNMKGKDEVLSIINRFGIHQGRELKLMQYAGGEPYRYMYRNYYPALRRVEIEVSYYFIEKAENGSNVSGHNGGQAGRSGDAPGPKGAR